ncbi:NAD-dependent epimerase/dehydratase family protein [Catelliglobosispora koreensis]|uniref:NAD-dependent epimerase/dehydratase family protein n=1 Tax=Catelliglobosispora koreensis TaxID=129052 RepID=UPI000372B338|nr:NAD(P)-dependent oxidoreductase [Catelliglobosispora koreensis]
MKYLVTGGAGFFGGILIPHLLATGARVVSIDRQPHWFEHPALTTVQGDIRDSATVEQIFAAGDITGVVHAAAVLAHGKRDPDLWSSNVEGTRRVAASAAAHGVRRFVFISSNCLWAHNFGRPVSELDEPSPIELYGKSKHEGEKLLVQEFGSSLDVTMIRTPTIIDEGRLGLLAILFDFINDGNTVWTVGGGANRYQFVYAQDLAEACLLSLRSDSIGIFNVGSDDVPTLGDAYRYVIAAAGSRSKVKSLPKGPAITMMKLASALKVSPLGPYHYRMIAEDFVFDTTKIKAELSWKPSLTNGEMLWRAYMHYVSNLDEIRSRTDVSAHRQATHMGPAIRLLKWLS